MSDVNLDTCKPGDALPPLQLPAITRAKLALFAGASGDHSPSHIDLDFGRQSGMPDVFAHSMLGMAYLGRLLTIGETAHTPFRAPLCDSCRPRWQPLYCRHAF